MQNSLISRKITTFVIRKRVVVPNQSHHNMEIYYTGIIIAIGTFLIIGLFHPIVIKAEYYFGTRCWWIFLLAGLACIGSAFFVATVLWSALIGVVGASLLWSIGELFHQKRRVERGWFPMNPKRRHEYQVKDGNEEKDENKVKGENKDENDPDSRR